MNDNLTKACQNSYNSTLACYHPWIVQKAAIMAMYALPDKEELLKRVFYSKKIFISEMFIIILQYPSIDRSNYLMKQKSTTQNFYLKQLWPWKRFFYRLRSFMKITTFLTCHKNVDGIQIQVLKLFLYQHAECLSVAKEWMKSFRNIVLYHLNKIFELIV